MMDKNREAFEKWLCETYSWGNETLNEAHFCDGSGFLKGKPASDSYYRGGDFYYDGRSCAEPLFWAWMGWQASRQAIEVELNGDACHSDDYFDDGYRIATEAAEEAITSLGIRVKGNEE